MKKTKFELIVNLYLIIFAVIAALEIIFRLSIIKTIKYEDLFRLFLFTNIQTMVVVFFIRLLPRRILRGATLTIILVIIAFYVSQDLYYRVLKGFFSFSLLGDAHAGVAFIGKVFKNISWIHLLYIIPIGLVMTYFFKYKKISLPKKFLFYNSTVDFVLSILVIVAIYSLTVISIPKNDYKTINSPYAYSLYDIYMENPIAFQTINRFGVLTYLERDIVTTLSDSEDILTMEESIESYLETLPDHQENEYTGYFEGKNLILIMAESFDTYAIDPVLTPNIYEMQQNSWNFTNYYSPLYFRNTADTEFMVQTSLYAHKSVNLTMESFKENKFNNTMPKLFEAQGYGSYSFHNYTDYFYPRTEFHPNTLGYDQYYDAIALNLLDEDYSPVLRHEWQSDVDLVNGAMDVLSQQEEPFFSYLLTVSGHMPYSDNHPIARKNLETVEALMLEAGYEVPKNDFLYYHAANYELDLAIGTLMERLEEENMLDDTVVMMFGDHYAYGIDQRDIAEYDDTKSLDNSLSFQRVPMMIYNPGLDAGDKEEVFASIDIMPTISNLFNLDIQYDEIFGKDVFGTDDNAVLFSNGSMITNNFMYNLEKDKITILSNDYTEEEATILINEYIYRLKINQWILETDYFNDQKEEIN